MNNQINKYLKDKIKSFKIAIVIFNWFGILLMFLIGLLIFSKVK